MSNRRERVDSSASKVPVPKYYLVRSDSGLWHLVDPREYGAVEHRNAEAVTARCGLTVDVDSTDDLMHVKGWLTAQDALEEYTADELFDEFKPFAGQCKRCLKSHQAEGATDLARIDIPDDYSPSR